MKEFFFEIPALLSLEWGNSAPAENRVQNLTSLKWISNQISTSYIYSIEGKRETERENLEFQYILCN